MADSIDLSEAKVRARREVAAALIGMSPGRRRAASIAVAHQLGLLPPVTQAATIMAFLSLPTEIDTWSTIRWAWDRGKRVAIPRIEPGLDGADTPAHERAMLPVLLEAADVPSVAAHPDVRPGAFGILTAPDAHTVPPAEIDVVLVPCQAVDRNGNRLGKGGGCYDRFLARPEVQATRIALVFQEQVLDAVPVAEGDQPLDMIVTEGEVLRFNRPATVPPESENLSAKE
ncbi:MAG: 5-formyltetrahydrofolate cyclo-ligase [Planctomycetota bacterium]|nr:5-formyltetrahydrofolate cyclo-ligase [Planctomycetota bacterium]